MGFFGNLFGKGGLGKAIDPFELTPLGKDKEQNRLVLPEINLMKAGDARQTALDFGQAQTPLALKARETALSDLSSPGATQEFFGGFQPTGFEQALASQHFANVMPDVERSIKHNLSLSGIESSPILAQQLGQARGQLGVSIGEILANQGQQRGLASLQARLAMDPISQIIQPISQQELNQSNLQDQLSFQRNIAQSTADFQAVQQQQQQDGALLAAIGSLVGGAGGFAVGGPAGASLGASLGGSLGGGFGGGAASPIGFGDALSLAELFQPSSKTITTQAGVPSASMPLSSTAGQTQSVFNGPSFEPIDFPEFNIPTFQRG